MRGKFRLVLRLCVLPALLLSGCMTAAQHEAQLPSAEARRTTLGVVQKDIKKGMSEGDVAAALGAPNIVTKDSQGRETWIYDKIATEAAYSRSSVSGSITGLLVGLGSGVAGGGLGGIGASQGSGASEQTERTLTVVIKFKNGVVDDLSYNESSF